MQVEALFRIWDYNYYDDKKTLPWFELGFSYWDSEETKKMIKLSEELKPWPDYLNDEELKKGRKLTDSEWQDLAQDWSEVSQWYPGKYEIESVQPGFDLDEDTKKKKGNKEKGLFYRRPLHEWRMNKETIKLIKDGMNNKRYDGFDYNRFNRIKAMSVILGDAMNVLNRRRKSMPAKYSDKIVQKLYSSNKLKIATIIDLSFEIFESVKLRLYQLERDVNGLKVRLKRHGEDRVDLVAQIAFLSKELKSFYKDNDSQLIDELSSIVSPERVGRIKRLQVQLREAQELLKKHDEKKSGLLFQLDSYTSSLQMWGKLRSK